MRIVKPLSDVGIKAEAAKAKRAKARKKLFDGGGLYLELAPSGSLT